VFGFDLIRLSTGSAVAGVLLDALSLREDHVQCVEVRDLDDPDRALAWFEVGTLPRPDPLAETLRKLANQVGSEPLTTVVGGLATSPVGGLDDLVRMLRTDILGWADAPVAAMACDALAAAYAGPALSKEASGTLSGPWLRGMAARKEHKALDLGPQSATLIALLERARRLDRHDSARLRDVPAVRSWANLVNEATWAVYLADRLRPVATAQLLLVRALHHAQLDADAATRGVWNAVSGCVQAVAVRDLLDDATYSALTAPWCRSIGPLD
jgi:hypothetical protein